MTFQQFQQKKPAVTKTFAIDTLKYWENTDSAITEYTYHFLDSTPNLKEWLFLYDGYNLYTQADEGTIQKVTAMGMYPYEVYVYRSTRVIAYGNLTFFVAAVNLSQLFTSGKQWSFYYYNHKGELKGPNAYSFAKFLKAVDEELYNRFIKEQKLKLKDYIRYLDEINQRHPF